MIPSHHWKLVLGCVLWDILTLAVLYLLVEANLLNGGSVCGCIVDLSSHWSVHTTPHPHVESITGRLKFSVIKKELLFFLLPISTIVKKCIVCQFVLINCQPQCACLIVPKRNKNYWCIICGWSEVFGFSGNEGHAPPPPPGPILFIFLQFSGKLVK